MKRVSSATGCNERDLNNTRVFWSQGAIPALAGLLVLGVLTDGLTGCHRSAPGKSGESTLADARRADELLPKRTAPPLPPLLPAPEEIASQVQPRRGGILRVHLDGEPSHLNPLGNPDGTALQVVTGLVYESLLDCPSPGTSGDYRPVLADSWQVSADGLRVSFHLRPGVKWHDGHAFGVLDVQATLEPLLRGTGPGGTVMRASLQDVATIEIAADRYVRLNLKRPSRFVLSALCDIPILPDHLLRGTAADAGALARQPIGTGPFRFAAWERGKRIRLVRATLYRGEPAALDEIVFEMDLDGARALMRTRRGEVDILPRVLPVHYPDDVDPVTLHGALSLWRLRSDRWAYVAVNHKRPPLDELHFRRALSALWDRERFARDLHQGLAHPLGAPPFGTIALPPPTLVGGGDRGRERAAAELDAGGYRDTNADGVRDLAGRPFRQTLLVAAGAHTAATEAHAFVFEARKAGLLVDLVTLDAPTLLGRVRKGDFDLALMQWEGPSGEDPGLLFESTGSFNYSGYHSAEVDATLDALRRAPEPSDRQRLWASLAVILAREQPVLFLYQFDVPALVARRVHALAAVGARLDLRHVWIDP
jgi:peptide/nickel transport system substrate-binding protein